MFTGGQMSRRMVNVTCENLDLCVILNCCRDIAV